MKNNLPKTLLTEAQFEEFRKGKFGYDVFLSSVKVLQGSIIGSAFFTQVRLETSSNIISTYERDCTKAGTGYWDLKRWHVSYNPANKRYCVKFIAGKEK